MTTTTTTSAWMGRQQRQQPGTDLKRFRLDLGMEQVLVLSFLFCSLLLVGGTQAAEELVSHVALAPTIAAKPPVLPPVAEKPPVVAAPTTTTLPPAAAKPAPATAPAASVFPPAAVPSVVPPPKIAPAIPPGAAPAPAVVVPPATAPATIAVPAQAPHVAAAPAPKKAPAAAAASPGPAAATSPVAAGPAGGNGELDPGQVGALVSLGMNVGLDACSVEPATVLTCDHNPITQKLVTLSVHECPANATLTDRDFGYLATDALSQLTFIDCAVLSPLEPPKILSTSLLDLFLMASLSPMNGWWLGRLHALQNLTVLDVTVVTGSGLGVIISSMNKLQYLTIQNASLSGTLPTTAWPQNLNILVLSGNNMYGQIPLSLSKLLRLEVLDLSHNGLSGHLPSYVGNLHNLQTLRLQNNGFTGEIPKSFANLRALTKLDLSFNNLNGSLPTELGMLALTELDLRNNTLLAGAIPFSTNALTNMKSLLVSGTSLCYDPTLTSAKVAHSLSVPICGGISPTLAPAYGPALSPSPAPAPVVAGNGHKKKPKVVAIVLSVLAVLVVLGGVVYCCCRWWGVREGYA